MCPHSCQSGKKILILCKFHLSAGMGCPCPVCKDIEDQVCPVKNTAAKYLFNVSKLARSKLIIKNCNIDFILTYKQCKLLYFTGANKSTWIWNIKLLDESFHRLCSCSFSQK